MKSKKKITGAPERLHSATGSPSLPTSRCPFCGYEMDAATHVGKEPAQPSAGDFSVCLNCGEMLEFNEILVLKPLPPETLDQLHADTREVLMKASRLINQRGRFQ